MAGADPENKIKGVLLTTPYQFSGEKLGYKVVLHCKQGEITRLVSEFQLEGGFARTLRTLPGSAYE